jgi:uncharacterized peroxidase-related enzyme
MNVKPLDKNEAAESVRPIYDGLEKKMGRVLNFFKMIAHKPKVLSPFLEFYEEVWAPGALSAKIKEFAYLRTSLMNGCDYWSRAHTASAKRQGVTDEQIQALKEPGGSSRSVFSDEEKAAIKFAETLTAWPASVQQSDLDELGKRFSTEQIAELVLTIGTANLTNRINEGMKTPVDV